ncbi:putative transmembrane protein [Cryptosporidium felis]|nr:putative transmembrane protein [Cryptosporidium felis]
MGSPKNNFTKGESNQNCDSKSENCKFVLVPEDTIQDKSEHTHSCRFLENLPLNYPQSRQFSFDIEINENSRFLLSESNVGRCNFQEDIDLLIDEFGNANELITESLDKNLQSHFDKISYYEKIKFFISRNYAFDNIRKLNSLPPIRIHELWKGIEPNIREVLFSAILIILTNRIRIWSNIDFKQKDYFIGWGRNYLNKFGSYLAVPEILIDQTIRIYNLSLDDLNSENIANIQPLKNTLLKYCINELQPKVNSIYREYNCSRLKNLTKLNNISDADSFLFVRNNSDFDIQYDKKDDNCTTAISMTNLPFIEAEDNLNLANSDNSYSYNDVLAQRRKTWQQCKLENEMRKRSNPPRAFFIIILALLRLHTIDEIVNSRTLVILQDIFLMLNDNDEYYKSSLLVFDSLQTLTYNDIKKKELKCDSKTLERGFNKSLRYLKVAGATVLGGAVLAAATTIAAPGILAGLGTLGITFSGIFGTTVTAGTSAATMSAVAGVGGAGLSGWKMSRRESPLQVFDFHHIGNYKDGEYGLLPILIGISGWLRNADDILLPWKKAFNGIDWMEIYSIEFEPEILSQLGNSITLTMSQDLAMFAGKAILLQTIVGTLTAALSWPIAIMQYAATLDNTWAVSRQKTEQAAVILADALCRTEFTGNRPVRLVGYSMGARLIFLTLQILHSRKQFNRVQDVALLGMPTSLNRKKWIKARCVVSNRLINVFSRSDWVLAFFYRYMQWGFHVAGISPVNIVGIENYDVTGLINSHDEYPDKIREILYYVNFF